MGLNKVKVSRDVKFEKQNPDRTQFCAMWKLRFAQCQT